MNPWQWKEKTGGWHKRQAGAVRGQNNPTANSMQPFRKTKRPEGDFAGIFSGRSSVAGAQIVVEGFDNQVELAGFVGAKL